MSRLPSKQLFNVYNSILKVAELRVQSYSPHLNLSKYNISSTVTEKELLTNLSDINNFIKQPYYSHIFLSTNNKTSNSNNK
jgi:hypothetical protein